MTGNVLPIAELSGSPRHMGREHGEQFRQAIHEFAERRREVCAKQAERAGWPDPSADVLRFCRSTLRHHERYSPPTYEEFRGIAEGADIAPDRLMICNGLTDIIDVFRTAPTGPKGMGECTAWLAAPEATAEGFVLAGQTWDMHPWAEQYVVAFRRRPKDGPASLTLSTAGCLSLVGLNEAGIAVGNNNLIPTDARPGVMYLAIVHHVLAQRSLAAAVNAIVSAPRLSGHNYYLAGPEGEIVDIETTATRSDVLTPASAIYAHANHFLAPELAELEATPASHSSLYRLDRIQHLLHDLSGDITPEAMMRVLADETGQGDCRICRTDPSDHGRTCAAVVMSPQQGRLWATKGPPSKHDFHLLDM